MAAKKAHDAAKVVLTPVTLEQDVKAALAKVKLGEVEAAPGPGSRGDLEPRFLSEYSLS